jgi:hypothetical protein
LLNLAYFQPLIEGRCHDKNVGTTHNLPLF